MDKFEEWLNDVEFHTLCMDYRAAAYSAIQTSSPQECFERLIAAIKRNHNMALRAAPGAERCPACGGNNGDAPCAYPREHERQPGCLKYPPAGQGATAVAEVVRAGVQCELLWRKDAFPLPHGTKLYLAPAHGEREPLPREAASILREAASILDGEQQLREPIIDELYGFAAMLDALATPAKQPEGGELLREARSWLETLMRNHHDVRPIEPVDTTDDLLARIDAFLRGGSGG